MESEIEVIESEESDGCTPGVLCVANEFFDVINQCALCGKLC